MSRNDYDDDYEDDDDDYDRPRRRRSYMRPHRGALILVFGILGLMKCCFIWGLIAWIMGRADLQAMAAGEMDPEGEGLTKAGVVMGMISVILSVLVILGYVFLFVFAAAMGPGPR